jgi:predicted PurR-regulated permease PerM
MMDTRYETSDRRRYARLVVAVATPLFALWTAGDYLVAVLWALLFAVAAWPLYRRFPLPRSGPRVLAPALFTALLAVAVLGPFLLVAIEVGRESQTVVTWIERAQQSGIPAPDWLAGIPLLGRYAEAQWQARLGSPEEAKALLDGLDRGALAGWSGALGGEVGERLLLLFVACIALFSFLRDGEALAERATAYLGRAFGRPGESFAGDLVGAVRGVVVGTILVALGEGLLIGIGYAVAGVPHAVLFGVLTAACAMLPLGAWLAFTAAALTLLATGGGVWPAAGVFGWGAAVMLVGDNFVQPALIGGAVELPVLWALVGILGGLATFGLIGLFLGPIIMAMARIMWLEWLERDLPR